MYFESIPAHDRGRVGLLIAAGFGALAVAACSGSAPPELNGGLPCGRGTTPSNGECVAQDSGATSDGATQTTTDGSAEASPATTDAGDASIGSDSATKADTNPVFSGDPCPNSLLYANCSNTCGGPDTACALVSCDSSVRAPKVEITSYSQLPLLLRTADHPGVDPKCPQSCLGTSTIDSGLAVRLRLPYSKNGIRMIVSSPWMVSFSYTNTPYCPVTPTVGCLYTDEAVFDYLVMTTDPNAPARNVLIEEAPPGEKCP